MNSLLLAWNVCRLIGWPGGFRRRRTISRFWAGGKSPALRVCLALCLLLTGAGCGASDDDPGTVDGASGTVSGSSGRAAEQSRPATAVPRPADSDTSPSAGDGQDVLPSEAEGPGTDTGPATGVPDTAVARSEFRPHFPQRDISPEQLRSYGLVAWSAPSIRLITDLPTGDADRLLAAGTALASFWPRLFGDLLPARDGSGFALTAYVMRDRELFARADLLPVSLPLQFHGLQQGSEFWMHDQTRDYYRRHLFLHEATHVFTRHIGGAADALPLWFLEGIAEAVATHRQTDDGEFQFNTFPDRREHFAGLNHLDILRQSARRNKLRSIEQVLRLTSDDFASPEAYAWSWGLTVFLQSHPRTREPFRKLLRRLRDDSPEQLIDRLRTPDPLALEIQWTQFVAHATFGFDFERTAISVADGSRSELPQTVTVRSDGGWQSAGVAVREGRTYVVETSGRFTLADSPRPWISESNGISFEYVDGRPVGQLLGTVLADDGDAVRRARSMLVEIPLGTAAEWTAPATGTLYLRINDDWGRLADNRGELSVTVRRGE